MSVGADADQSVVAALASSRRGRLMNAVDAPSARNGDDLFRGSLALRLRGARGRVVLGRLGASV